VNLSGLAFLVHESVLNIRRNGLMSLAALGTVTVALTVLGASLWTAHRINEFAETQPQKFNQIDVFLANEIERPQTLAVQERLRRLPHVKRVHLTTKEVAWARLQSDEPGLTQEVPGNPLPDKFEVEAADVNRVGQLAHLVRNRSQFPEVANVNDASEEIRTMLGFARVIKVVGGGAALGLFVATLFIVHNTIRLTVFARRREIRIMQLVGATPGFIRFPLLLEGLFHGVIGAAIASGIILLCGREVSRFIAQFHSPLLGDVPSRLGPGDVVFGLVVIGAFVGLAGSYLSMRRFLKQI
jgi:cell division transport system permease protein